LKTSLPTDLASVERAMPVSDILSLLRQEYGDPPARPYREPLSELVLTVLSQHTSDANSDRAFESLMAQFGNWEAVAEGDVEDIAGAIKMGGLARVKAPRIKEILRIVRERCGGFDLSFLKDLPTDEARAWLLSLPGVGPKTAACVLLFSLGRPALPVDTHIYRVARRLGLIGAKTSPDQAHEVLESLVAPEEVYPFHMYLITHGRRICKAPRPLCHLCVLNQGCPSAFLESVPPRENKKRRADDGSSNRQGGD